MRVGVPTEIKAQENRVALTPAGAERLHHAGHQVLVQSGAGAGSGFADDAYQKVGARILPGAAAVFGEAELILKVKEPLESEWPLLRKGQTLFTYLHLAASRSLTEALVKTGAYCFAYETLEVNGELPLLTPMSEVAGRMAIQAGAKYLEKPQGGSGILLGGVPGVASAKVVVVGGGVSGTNAARMAMGMEAQVTILDKKHERLAALDLQFGGQLNTIFSTVDALETYIPQADLVVGAVLVPGAAAPKLITADAVRGMKPGSVIVDLAAETGGNCELTEPGAEIVHHGVAVLGPVNLPATMPLPASQMYSRNVHALLQELLPVSDLRLFAGCARYPHNLAQEVPLTQLQEGVYEVRALTLAIRIIVVAQLPKQEHNAMLLLFSAREDLIRYAQEHYRPHSPETSTLLVQLFKAYGEDPTMSDKLKEFYRETIDQLSSGQHERIIGRLLARGAEVTVVPGGRVRVPIPDPGALPVPDGFGPVVETSLGGAVRRIAPTPGR